MSEYFADVHHVPLVQQHQLSHVMVEMVRSYFGLKHCSESLMSGEQHSTDDSCSETTLLSWFHGVRQNINLLHCMSESTRLLTGG